MLLLRRGLRRLNIKRHHQPGEKRFPNRRPAIPGALSRKYSLFLSGRVEKVPMLGPIHYQRFTELVGVVGHWVVIHATTTRRGAVITNLTVISFAQGSPGVWRV